MSARSLASQSWRTLCPFFAVHSTSGSCTNVSRTEVRLSLLSRRTRSVISAALRKTPVERNRQRDHYRAEDRLTLYTSHSHAVDDVVRQTEGNFLRNLESTTLRLTSALIESLRRVLTLSNKQLKSTCTVSPVFPSIRIFSQCRSPNLFDVLVRKGRRKRSGTYPRTKPTIEMTAAVRE